MRSFDGISGCKDVGIKINAKTAITAIAPIAPPTITPDLTIKPILGFSSKSLTIPELSLAHILS